MALAKLLMAVTFPFTFTSPIWLIIAIVCSLAIALTTIIRRPNLPASTYALTAAGLVLLLLAAGGMQLLLPDPRQVVVMVDLSPSTRTAQYRYAESLQKRIAELLGQTPYRIIYFAEDQR